MNLEEHCCLNEPVDEDDEGHSPRHATFLFYNLFLSFPIFYILQSILQSFTINFQVLHNPFYSLFTMFYSLLQSFTMIKFQSLQSFTINFTVLYNFFSLLQSILVFYNQFYSLLQSFTAFYNLLQSFTIFYHLSQ